MGPAHALASTSILEELEEVLTREFHHSKEETREVLRQLEPKLTIVKVDGGSRIVPGDPDDDKIVWCAIETGAMYIVTYDRHLLEMKEHQGIRIVTPEQLLSASPPRTAG